MTSLPPAVDPADRTWPATSPSSGTEAGNGERTAILNGFGRTLGDSIIGLQALWVAIRLHAIPPRPVLFRLPGLGPIIEATYAAAEFAEIRELPWTHAARDEPFAPAGDFANLIDVRDFAFDPGFLEASMIDFFLQRLGLGPAGVPACLKRNGWLAPRVRPARPDLPAGYILVCPRAANSLRSMPEEIHRAILDRLAADGPVVTQGPMPPDLREAALSCAPAANLEELCAIVAGARWVISTDTAMVHLADAFAVPCLAFLPTHDPQWRVRDYPLCTPVALMSRLPPGIEFARDAADLIAAREAWLPAGSDLTWLYEVLDRTPLTRH